MTQLAIPQIVKSLIQLADETERNSPLAEPMDYATAISLARVLAILLPVAEAYQELSMLGPQGNWDAYMDRVATTEEGMGRALDLVINLLGPLVKETRKGENNP